uniref:Uncharacterized protein n=1 Tax=Nelumbo nucifera TaxID=4432 RepID=A0A822Y5S3_NELNU|nr:TPA_asm: hypothetical protein HUJ06_029275 [Nelumbo nucifera]
MSNSFHQHFSSTITSSFFDQSPFSENSTQHVVPACFFAKQAAPTMLKNIFLEVKKKFNAALGVLWKEKIRIDPDDPVEVDLFSESQRIQYTIQIHTRYSRCSNISKLLLRSDKKGMALLMDSHLRPTAHPRRLGIWREDLLKYGEQLELKIFHHSQILLQKSLGIRNESLAIFHTCLLIGQFIKM